MIKTKFLQASIGISMVFLTGSLFVHSISTVSATPAPTIAKPTSLNTAGMVLGAFSISLSVKDLTVSKQFYENLGFKAMGGDMKSNYLIMKNGNALIGLFQGMFKGNIITFNPGWDENAKNTPTYTDIREIQKELKSKGIKLDTETDEKMPKGPASLTLTDPDGNPILVDQHR